MARKTLHLTVAIPIAPGLAQVVSTHTRLHCAAVVARRYPDAIVWVASTYLGGVPGRRRVMPGDTFSTTNA